MVSLTKLAEFHLFSTCLPQPGNVKWSVDSQVAVVSRKGISLFEFLPDPGIGRESFKIFKTVRAFISISQVKIFKVNPGFANPEDVFRGTKHQVFSLLQDKILAPKGYEKKGVQYHNFFSKVEWSNNPIYVASHGPPKCLLGALTTNLQLYIFCHNNIPYGNKRRRYNLRINLTELYNKELLSSWTILEKLDFEQYEKRLKELSIVDFCWISLWDEVNYNFNSEHPVYETGIMTCHANGDICIWRIYCPTDNAYFTKLIFKKEVLKDEIIRSVKFHKVSSDLAIIVLGTNSGIVKLYRLSKQVPMHANLTEFFSPLTATYEYTIDDGIEIWEKDFLQIDMIKLITTVSDEKSINFTPAALKTAKKFDVLVLKHPNFLISFTVWVAEQHNIVLEINHIQIPQSPIMGIVHRVKGQFILCHEQGATSTVTLKNGLVSYFEESLQIFRVQQNLHYSLDRQRYKRFFYYGMDISPNRAMICVCRHLGNHFDHKMKTPGKVEFYSLLTHNDPASTWKTVKELYEKCYNLERIADALQVLRYEFKRFDHLQFDWLKTEESYKDMYVEDIQFYYWCLRAMYRTDIVRLTRLTNIADPRAQVLLQNSVDLMKHIKEVQDHLVECNCVTLVEKITENPENPNYILNSTNQRSLTNIKKYLSQKDHMLFQKALPMPKEVLSECPLCSKPVSYRSNPNDMTSGTIIPGGYLWNELVCSDFHDDADVCILSLIPIDEFPTRVCTYCQVSCLAEPSFGQKPRCILCGTTMYVDMPITEFDDVPKEYVESDADESLERKTRKGEGDSDDEGLISDSDNNLGSNSEADSGQDDSDDDY